MTLRPTPTIRDVAREAGVSIGTVSKALNKTGAIAAETRARVIEVAVRLQFRPNTLAKSLHSGLSGSIGLISNDSFGRFTMPIMEGLERVLAPQGIGVFMCNATDDPARELAHVEQLMAKQIDGIVVTARRSDRRPSVHLEGLGVPVIYVFAHSGDPDALTLLPDDKGGAELAVNHLIQIGRRRIAHVTGPEHFEAVRLRGAGYLNALAAANFGPLETLNGKWSEAWGRDAIARLYGPGKSNPDALFCGNDLIARGAADALREMGRLVPQDVAIVGFDNWAVMAEASRPPLTSVDMNLSELGAEAGLCMAAMIGGKVEHGQRLLPCTLITRASTLGY
ncbi:MAG: LacI family DNA-binding transcriptional regulator [Paracoccaceae bacterium]